MSESRLFQLIRKEDVAVWAGAGMSLYAGYPSGKRLCEILKDELSKDEREQLTQGDSLRAVADDFIAFRNGSKNELYRILKNEFGKSPSATDNHDLLSRIPHFKNIFTTNYDSLIEDSYASRCNIIRNDYDVLQSLSQLPNIFKVHGDLLNPEKIVISGNDYSSFIRIDNDTPFWTSLRSTLSKQVLLFMGYGFEDENLWAWLDKIDNAIGQHRKERFLIAPNWTDLKIRKLQQRNVSYINTTIEEFLNNLHTELKLHIAADLERKLVTQDTFNRYVSFYDYGAMINYKEGQPKLTSLYKTDQSALNKINFTVTKSVAKEISKFSQGIGRKLEINREQLLNLEHFVDDFRMPLNLDDIKSFHIIRQGNFHKVTIEFPDDDLFIDEHQVELIQASKSRFEAKTEVYGFALNIALSFVKNGLAINFTIKFPDKFPPISQCLRFMRAISAYSTGRKAILYVNGKPITVTNTSIATDPFLEAMLNYYHNLQKIERHCSVNFVGLFADESIIHQNKAAEIVKLIEGEPIVLNIPNGLEVSSGDSEAEIGGLQLPSVDYTIVIPVRNNENEKLLGLSLDIGESSILISNIVSIDYSQDGKRATLKNKTGQVFRHLSSLIKFDKITWLKSN